MNKLIWKGIDSSTIKGLLICELPPITKPKMRVQETVIDGVDGSIIEELGYESYDKTIKIGLTYDFDIDEVIKYFSGEGEVVFSNEPDKYYKASILNRIDYERLLRFREATVKFRVQPFKYQYQEEKVIAKTGSVEGTEIKISDVKATEIKIDGKSSQETRSGKNLLPIDSITSPYVSVNENGTYNIIAGTITNGVYPTGKEVVLPAGTYTFSSTELMQEGVQIYFWNATDNKYDIMLNNYVDKKTFTLNDTKTMRVMFYLLPNTTLINKTFGLQLELGSTATEYEQHGVSPSPIFPSEIKSVGYRNFFDGELELGYININTGVNVDATNNIRTKNYIPIQPDKTYTLSSNVLKDRYAIFYDNNKQYIKYINVMSQTMTGTFISPENAYYIRWYDVINADLTTQFQLEKGTKKHSYIPYGKYGIEFETNGKNFIYNTNKIGNILYFNSATNQDYYIFKAGTYTLSFDSSTKPSIYIKTATTNATSLGITKPITFTSNEDFNIWLYRSGLVEGEITNIQLEEGDTATEYEPYQNNKSVIILNEPPRSLPNGVKDIAYIRNNKLYVDRYVGNVVLDGSEGWETWEDANTPDYIQFYLPSSFLNNNYIKYLMSTPNAISSHFKFKETVWGMAEELMALNPNTTYTLQVKMDRTDIPDLATFKTWLSTHNTQVDYELAEPYTEEYGEISILNLVDGENNISNSEDANMIIDYIETLNVNNLGNHTAKPIFEIEGVGKVDFILNNSKVFSYNFDNDGKVVIDSEKEDAYLGLTLKNRNMNGDFPIFNSGENKFTWDGLIKNISVSKKSRWL